MAMANIVLALAALASWWYTRELVEDAKNSSQIQQRAYVAINGMDIQGFDDAKSVLNFDIRNVGLTPASSIFISGNITIGEYPPKAPLPIPPDGIAHISIAPSMQYTGHKPLDGVISDEQKKSIHEGKAVVYASGSVHYTDVFGHRHESKFQRFFGGPDGVPASGVMHPLDDGNEMD